MKSITEHGMLVARDRADQGIRIGDTVRLIAWGWGVPCYRVGEEVKVVAAGPKRLKCENRDGEVIYAKPSQVRNYNMGPGAKFGSYYGRML